MKVCAACNQDLPKDGFSKKQWQLKGDRRCKKCTAENREVSLDALPAHGVAASDVDNHTSEVDEDAVTEQQIVSTHGVAANNVEHQASEVEEEMRKASIDPVYEIFNKFYSSFNGLNSVRGERSPGAEGASCWICLEEEADDSGEPLRRDCSCRGGSGWAHVACLVEYSKEKSKIEHF